MTKRDCLVNHYHEGPQQRSELCQARVKTRRIHLLPRRQRATIAVEPFVGLEEVEFDDESGQWLITIGFSRPWDRPKTQSAALREDPLKRSYKVVRIDDADGSVISLKDRILTAAG